MKPNPQQIKCSKDDYMKKKKASNKNEGEKKNN
jgi:hypothetical protein